MENQNQTEIHLSLPNNFKPRDYQECVFEAIENNIKRILLVWHRRAGKDLTIWNCMARSAFNRVGIYYYIYPTYAQGKKALWEGMDYDGRRFLDYIPKELISDLSESEMRITLINGSIIRVIGVENVDSVLGTNPCFCAFSEYSLLDSSDAWDHLRPILAQNDGIAAFMFTPRGMNHAYQLFNNVKDSPEWYVSKLTVDDTGVFTKETLEREKREMLIEGRFLQEYYCKFLDSEVQMFKNFEQYIYEGGIVPSKNKKYVLGCDLGKMVDATVVTPIEIVGSVFKVAKPLVLQKTDFVLQKTIIKNEYYRWNEGRMCIDATGLGAPVCDDLRRDIKNLEEFIFKELSRTDLLTNLLVRLTNGDLRLPNDAVLIDQLRSFQYIQDGAHVRMKVPAGMHDDHVMSLALAVWILPKEPLRMTTQEQKDVYNFDANVLKRKLRANIRRPISIV